MVRRISKKLSEDAFRLEQGATAYPVVDLVKAAYEHNLFNYLKLKDRKDADTIGDLTDLDTSRLISYFSKKPEFEKEEHDVAGIYSVEFISDKFDIEIFPTFMTIYRLI